jgi:Cu2+-exporting ATPase
MKHNDHGQASEPHAGHKMSKDRGSHDRHAGHSVAVFRDKFWLSFVLTVPVLFWSTDVQRWFGYTAPSFPGSRFIPAILGTVIFFYGGLVRNAELTSLEHRADEAALRVQSTIPL